MNQEILITIIFAYLMGSIPTAYLLGKWIKNIDIREHGSGNVGATNVFRVLGKKWGIIALLVDVLKGAIAVLFSIYFLGDDNSSWYYLLAMAFSFLGHLFPIWLKFKGGKGVAVAGGAFLVLKPLEVCLVILVFLITVTISRYVSLGSILASFFFPIFVYLNFTDQNSELLTPYIIISIIIALAIILMHKKNIKRLIDGNENKIFSKTK